MNKTSQQNRINEIIEAVMKVAKGDFSVQVKISDKNDEFDALAMGLNMMIEDIRTSYQELQSSQHATLNIMEDLERRRNELNALNIQLQERITERKQAEEKEKQYIQDQKYLSETAMGFVELPPDANIYEYIAEHMKKLVGNSIVIVNSFDPESNLTQVRAITGMGKLSKSVLKILGKDPMGTTYTINEVARHHLLTGKYHTVPGKLYELSFGQMPMPICRALEKLLGIREIHSMGFTWEGQVLGSAVIIRRDDAELDNINVIETFINQATVVLQRQQAEGALTETEDKYKRIFENVNDMVISVSKYGKIIEVNERIEDIFGYTRKEVLGKNFMKLGAISIMDLPRTIKLFRHAAKIGEIEDTTGKGTNLIVLKIKRKNGEHALIEVSSRALKKNGKLEGFLSIIRDITERKKAEMALRESEEKYRDLFETSQDAIVLLDQDFKIVDCNKAAVKISGISREKVINKYFGEEIAPLLGEKKDEYVGFLIKTLQGEGSNPFEVELTSKKGVTYWLETYLSPIIKDDEVSAMQVIAHDITERKKAEEALRESEERFRTFFENEPDYCYMISTDGTILDVNKAALKTLGYRKKELVGKPIKTIYAPEYLSKQKMIITKWKRTSKLKNEEMVIITKKGERRTVLLSADAINGKDGKIVHSISVQRDITERKKAEQELLRLSTAVMMSTDSITITDLNGTIIDINEAAMSMYGTDVKGELTEKKLIDIVAPEDRRKVSAAMEKILEAGHIKHLEYDIIIKDKSTIPVELSASIMRNVDGKPTGVVGISRDITDRKRAEREMKRRLMRFDLEDGNLYLVKEDSPNFSTEVFKDLLKAGYQGLVLSRIPRRKFKLDINQVFDFLWISEKGEERSIPPKLNALELMIENRSRRMAIMLDRLDYLVAKNGFNNTLTFVHHLRDLAYLRDHIIIVSIDPSTVSEKELRQLEKESQNILPQQKGILPNDLLEVLKFIYEQNLVGAKPSYTAIGTELDISKPTLRKRVRQLTQTGYVRDNTKGRSKIVELTEKGRVLFIK